MTQFPVHTFLCRWNLAEDTVIPPEDAKEVKRWAKQNEGRRNHTLDMLKTAMDELQRLYDDVANAAVRKPRASRASEQERVS